MTMNRRGFLTTGAAGLAGLFGPSSARAGLRQKATHPILAGPRYELVQPELFGVAGGQPNCWADFDGDGDLDLFVGFKAGVANRLYRNDRGRFTEVAGELGLGDLTDTRAAAWGDFNSDGHLDLYVGFTRRSGAANRLYRNDGGGKRFTEVGHALGVDVMGETRQVSWIDFDNDGKVDLFVAFRDAPNMLFHNEGNRFVDVARDMGEDGRLDLFVANQDGTLNGLFRNDGSRFVDVARDLGMDAAGRPATFGSNGPSVIDYDNDGRLDLFVAGYGRNFLYHNDGKGRFTDVASAMGVAGGDKATPSNWGDDDNDGRPDLYVSSYVDQPLNEHDFFYRNEGGRFVESMPDVIAKHGATHGVQWADFDGDGALDLALTNNNPSGGHFLFRNVLPASRARQSIQVLVLDEHGHHTRAGSEVRVYAPGTRNVLGSRLVDSGSGYCSQSVMPVHIGLGGAAGNAGKVDVEVTAMTKRGRTITRVTNVNPDTLPRRVLVVRTAAA
jgi:hypothetical protein